MFDVGFWELVVIAVVALIVIGPERLPKAARVAGMWLGRARRTLASVKSEPQPRPAALKGDPGKAVASSSRGPGSEDP
jgi:Sec-independent protein translocase protein TatA